MHPDLSVLKLLGRATGRYNSRNLGLAGDDCRVRENPTRVHVPHASPHVCDAGLPLLKLLLGAGFGR